MAPLDEQPDRDFADLRREVIEARNQTIKTENQLKNLHAELKSIDRRHEEMVRRSWYASAAAYGAFLLLTATAGFFIVRAVAAREKTLAAAARVEADKLQERAQEQSYQLSKQSSERNLDKVESDKAFAAYRAMAEGSGEGRLAGIDAFASITKERLTGLERRALEDRARALKYELGTSFFERGAAAFRRGDWKATADTFKRFLALEPGEDDATQASAFAGIALATQKRYEEAIPLLERVVARPRGVKNGDQAFLALGQSYEAMGRKDQAAEIYAQGLKTFPRSEHAPAMQNRYRAVTRAAASTEQPPSPAPP